MLMASLRDPYAAAAAAGVGVGMLAASQLAQLNQLMMQQQQHAQQLQLQQQQPLSPSQQPGALAGTPLGTPPECQSPPISRTYTYKKVTKPLLERKRRARINRCLDELKELMVGALEAEGENVSKLEKADILELTVRHLQRITKPRDVAEDASRFQAGFSQCASEACHFLLGLPGLDAAVGRRLVAHLSQVVNQVGLAGAGLGAGASLDHGAPLRPASAASAVTTASGAYSPPASPDHEQEQDRLPRVAGGLPGQPSLGLGVPHHPAALAAADRVSPGTDGECRVSSSTSSLSWGRVGKRSRSPSRSDGDDDSEDDPDADSDVPVNYTSAALRRQPERKRSRVEESSEETTPGLGPAGPQAEVTDGIMPDHPVSSPSGSFVSSTRGPCGSDRGSDDEDKGPMWRPW